MTEVDIKFERENLEGIVAVGSYIIDNARRFGIRFVEPCDIAANEHFCKVTVTSGAELLSGETKLETEYFLKNSRGINQRLACQARIEKPGEIVVMTEKTVQDEKPSETQAEKDQHEEYRKAFAEMPLEKKIVNLVQLESIALSETVAYIFNSPFTIADKVMDVMAGFGIKKEEKQKTSARPEEHISGADTNGSNGNKQADSSSSESVN